MKYPKNIKGYESKINRFAQYKAEMGASGIDEKLEEIEELLKEKLDEMSKLVESPERANEPDLYRDILSASSQQKTILKKTLTDEEYIKKLKGALIGRFAGCALGVPVENMAFEELKRFAQITDMDFPPTNYWKEAPAAYLPRYKSGITKDFTLSAMKDLSDDDDIAYTLLSLLILEEYGADFTIDDVAKAWIKYLPIECTFTAERTALLNLMDGISAKEAGEVLNPDSEFIGAAIRCDGWAYVNPLNPQKASEFAHRDAYLTHRKSGLYSAMYFAAVIACAFGTATVEEALNMGLEYIPQDCEFSRQMRWALDISPEIRDYRDANREVTKRFAGMHPVHAINNACLTVWGALLGAKDFENGITQTVAMAYDNDCTAATVGSILGAFHGIDAIDEKWYKNWNNTAISYFNGIESFEIDDVIERFCKI